jgi:Uma2 family endonuclease
MLTIYNEKEEKYQSVEELDASQSYTYADYLEWKFTERIELIRGRVFKTKSVDALVQRAYVRIVTQLYTGLSNTDAKVFHAPFDVRLPVHNFLVNSDITSVVQPDICAICNASIVDGRGCYGVPDLVMEILSPGDTLQEVESKIELYQDAGLPEYWLVNPSEKSVTVFMLNAEGRFNQGKHYAGKDLVRSTAVQGFIIMVSDIFK